MLGLECKKSVSYPEGSFVEGQVYPVMVHPHIAITSTAEGNKFKIPLTPHRRGGDGQLAGGEIDLEGTGLSEIFNLLED